MNQCEHAVGRRFSGKPLHVVSGQCLLDLFVRRKRLYEDELCVPFRESLCWGGVCEPVFSVRFNEIRARFLGIGTEEYERKVIGPLAPLFSGNFDPVILWFGEDMFCRINVLALLAYLGQSGFSGKVLLCTVDEHTGETVGAMRNLEPWEYPGFFREIFLERRMPLSLPDFLKEAVEMYLHYEDGSGEIFRYIRNRPPGAAKKELVGELLRAFPRYGLGDTQYEALIDAARGVK